MSCCFFGALALPFPSFTCIRQAAIQVELVRACTEAGACDAVSTRAVHPLCFTGVCFCCLLSICFPECLCCVCLRCFHICIIPSSV